jgi:hypothetical protein
MKIYGEESTDITFRLQRSGSDIELVTVDSNEDVGWYIATLKDGVEGIYLELESSVVDDAIDTNGDGHIRITRS